MPKKSDPKVKERCVRLVLDHLQEYPTLTAAGATSEELAEICELKAEVRRLEEDNEILRRASGYRASRGCQIAARTCRLWAQPARPVAACTISDAVVEDKLRELAWTVHERGCAGAPGRASMDAAR